jgi:hypothetical protein
MKLDQIFEGPYDKLTMHLEPLVHDAIQYAADHPKTEEGDILRQHIAPMLSHIHDNPGDVEIPGDFTSAVNILQGNLPNPNLADLRRVVALLHTAIPHYHQTYQGI